MFIRSRRVLARGLMFSMGSILVLFAGGVYWQEVSTGLAALDDLLYRKARLIAATIPPPLPSQPDGVSDSPFRPGIQAIPPESDLLYVRWYDAEGRLLQFSGTPPTDPLQATAEFSTMEMLHQGSPVVLRQLTLTLQHEYQIVGYLQLATTLDPLQENLRLSRLFLSLAVPLGLGSIGLVSWWMGGRAMLPIRQAHEDLERFTANASHELRNPIAAILNNAEVGLMAESPSEQQFRLQRIVDLSQSMNTLINSLFLLARQGQTGFSSPSPVNLTHLLRQLGEEYEERATERGVRWTQTLLPETVVIRGHWELLRLAVANFLSNACRYTPEQGMIHLRLTKQGNWAQVSISDTGVGIPAEALPHIFERFYRVDSDRSRQSGGFGLGLAIAHRIITLHGGQIRVASQPGQGSTFCIELPLL
jgi:signal transduction histidine kinase